MSCMSCALDTSGAEGNTGTPSIGTSTGIPVQHDEQNSPHRTSRRLKLSSSLNQPASPSSIVVAVATNRKKINIVLLNIFLQLFCVLFCIFL